MTSVNFFNKVSVMDYAHLNKVIDWQGSLKSVRLVFNSLRRLMFLAVGKFTTGYSLAAYDFARHCVHFHNTQGVFGLIRYLKASQILLMKGLASDSLLDCSKVGPRISRTKGGLPRIIPSSHRKLLRSGNKTCIRFWLSLFNLYRVLELNQNKLSVKTITDQGVDLSKVMPGLETFAWKVFWPITTRLWFKGVTPMPQWKWEWQIATKVGPVGGSTLSTMPRQAYILVNTQIGIIFREFLDAVDLESMWPNIENIALAAFCYYSACGRSIQGCSGRLALKIEAAGKVRVFAIVDYFTNILLRPLHEWLFSILRNIPQDGTFDQHRPLQKLIEGQFKTCYSFDLTAATDRLPLAVQVTLLGKPLSTRIAVLWGRLFSERDFAMPTAKVLGDMQVSFADGPLPRTIRYSVGQPMGALSSWAMLALTHHFLVQYSAHLVGIKPWFSDYALLGDDIVICHSGVAKSYLRVMNSLGVPINLSKSLVSLRATTFEFAKVFVYEGEVVSGVSPKEVSAASKSLAALTMLLSKGSKGTPNLSSLAAYLRFSGLGYKTVSRMCSPLVKQGRRLTLLLAYLRSPWGPAFLNLKSWLGMLSFNDRIDRISANAERGIIEQITRKFVDPLLDDPKDPLLGLETVRVKRDGKKETVMGQLMKISYLDFMIDDPNNPTATPENKSLLNVIFDKKEQAGWSQPPADIILNLHNGCNYIRELCVTLNDSLKGKEDWPERNDLIAAIFAAFRNGDCGTLDTYWEWMINYKNDDALVPRDLPVDRPVNEPVVSAGTWLRFWLISRRVLALSSAKPIQYALPNHMKVLIDRQKAADIAFSLKKGTR